MLNNIINKIKRAFLFFETDYGFSITEENYSKECFGNALIKYESDLMQIVITRDRFQFFCEFSSSTANNNRFDIEIILKYLNENEDRLMLINDEWRSLKKSAEVIKRHFKRILKMFSPGQYKNIRIELEMLKNQRVKKHFR